MNNGTPKGIRIPVARMKTVCPRPLDDGGKNKSIKTLKNYITISPKNQKFRDYFRKFRK